jgi:hypothetical protein
MVDKKEELRMIKLLYQVIMDESVQRRFDTTITCNMATGEIGKKRLIDECEEYLIEKAKQLYEQIDKEV